MHHSSSTKLVPAGSLSVTGLMVRLGSATPGFSGRECRESFQLVMPPVRMAQRRVAVSCSVLVRPGMLYMKAMPPAVTGT